MPRPRRLQAFHWPLDREDQTKKNKVKTALRRVGVWQTAFCNLFYECGCSIEACLTFVSLFFEKQEHRYHVEYWTGTGMSDINKPPKSPMASRFEARNQQSGDNPFGSIQNRATEGVAAEKSLVSSKYCEECSEPNALCKCGKTRYGDTPVQRAPKSSGAFCNSCSEPKDLCKCSSGPVEQKDEDTPEALEARQRAARGL